MSARTLVLLLAAVLLVPGALAAVDPNPAAFDMGAPVNGIAVSQTGDRFAGASQDPSTTGFGAQAIVYQMWAPGGNTPFFGPADPEECDGGVGGASCDNDALAVATSADGTRMVVASHINADRGSLVFFIDKNQISRVGTSQSLGGGIEGTEIEGVPTGLAMSDAGNRIVLSTIVDGTPTDSSRLYVWEWGGTPKLITDKDPMTINEVITDVDISGDGELIVAAGDKPLRIRTVSTDDSVYRDGFPPDAGVNAVDVAGDHADHWSIAGFDGGSVTLHSDDSNRANHHEAALKATSDSITAAAIRDDASAFAFGSDAGAFWVYDLDTTDGTFTLIKKTEGLPGAVTDLAFSGDGASLAVASRQSNGNGRVTLYGVGDAVVKGWHHEAPDALGRLAIDGAGESIISAFGDDVVSFEAIHDIRATVTGSATSVRPGEDRVIDVQYRNAGNRFEAITITPEAPAGWQATLDHAAFPLAPDATRTISLALTVPSSASPGPYTIALNHTDGSGEATAIDIPVTIPTVKRWALSAVSGTSLSIENGAPAAFVVSVTNEGNVLDTTDVQVTGLPRGWTASTEPASVSLAPGASKEVSINVDAPDGAPQLAQATIRASLTKDATKSVSLTATVGAMFGLALDMPATVPITPGTSDTFTISVVNSGNAVDSFQVSLGNMPEGWRAAFQNGLSVLQVQALGPGDTRDVIVSLQSPATVLPTTQVQLQVSAASTGDADEIVSRGVLISVQAHGSPTDTTPGLPLVVVLGALAVVAARRRR